MEPVKNYNISATTYALLTPQEKLELDEYMQKIGCTYTITE